MTQQISSSDKPVTMAILQEFYQQIYPYLGGNKAVDSNPVGHFGFFLLPSAPAGYLECKGQRLSATAFPLLFNALKEFPAATRAMWGAGDADWITEFDLPDMRGEFPRVSGTNAHTNQGSGAEVGVHQDGTSFPQVLINTSGAFNTSGQAGSGISKYDSSVSTGYAKQTYQRASQASSIDNYVTSRPTNTSLLGCVKYTYVTQEVEYSPEERVVGIWKQEINSVLKQKPVYQRTFVVDTVTGESSGTYTTGIVASELSDIQNIISMNGTYHAYFSDQYHYDIDIGNNTYRPSIEANEEKHKLSFLFHPVDKAIYYQNSTGMNFTDLKLTVQYLKLTDSWQTV